jgi:hypothetical protein
MSHGYHLSTDRPAWPEAVRARREILAAWRTAGRGACGNAPEYRLTVVK